MPNEIVEKEKITPATELNQAMIQNWVKEAMKDIEPTIQEMLTVERDNGVAGSGVSGKSEVVWYSKTIGGVEQDKIPQFKSLSPEVKDFIKEMRDLVLLGEKKAAQDGTDPYGGILMPEEVESTIIEAVYDKSVLLPLCTLRRTTRDTLKLRRLKQSLDPETALSLFGGVQFSYLDAGEEIGETRAEWENLTMVLHKVGAIVVFPNELLSDSDINVMNYLTNLLRRSHAYLFDYNILNGSGIGRPLGILNDDGTLSVSRETSGKISYNDFLALDKRLLEIFANPVWLCRKSTWMEVVSSLITAEHPEIYFDARGKTAGGYPVIQNICSANAGSLGDLVLATMENYEFLLNDEFRVDTSIHYKFATDQPALRVITRFNGMLTIPQSVAVLSA